MTDPRNLRIKVQADRLPNVGSKAQIALRISAVIDGTDGALAAAAANEIQPWRWTLTNGSGTWNPHDPAAWKFWSAAVVHPTPPVSATVVNSLDATTKVTAAVTAPADFDPVGDDGTRRFHRRVDEEIASIVSTGGLDAALCIPAGTTELTARTVFGLVESLTGLPHPVSVAMNVFTVFTIDPAPTDPTIQFFAAPLFGPSGGGLYDLNTAPPSSTSDVNGTFYRLNFVAHTGTTPMFPTGSVDMRPSLPWAEIALVDDTERLIDMTTMLVKKPAGGNGLADDDWAASLSRRIAETMDPWARVLGVLDTTVTAAITDATTGIDLRRMLATDLGGPGKSSMLTALDSVAWSVVGDRVAASPVAAPPGASLLQGLANRQTDFWDSAAALIFAAGDRGAGGVINNAGRANFASIASSRLKGLIGLPSNPVDATVHTPPEAPSIESDDGVRQFVARHWLGGPDLSPVSYPLAKGATRVIAARMRAIQPSVSGISTADPAPGSLLDLGPVAAAAPVVPPATPTKIGFDIRLVPPSTDFTLTIAFVLTPGRPPPPTVVVTGKGAALTVGFVVDGVAQPVMPIPRGQPLHVEVAVARAAVDQPVAITLTAGGSITVSANRLLAGPFYLALTAAGADIPDVGIVMPDKTATSLRAALNRVTTGPGLRADLALSMIGPYIPGLTAGRLTWDVAQPPLEQQTAAKLPLDQRLVASIAALAGAKRLDGTRPSTSLYDVVLNRALADAGLTGTTLSSDQKALAGLLANIFEAARADAVRRAHALVPSAANESGNGDDHSRRLTIDAPPLVFRFDQLQSIVGADDLWTRLSGLGVLIARTATLTEPITAWRSLNVATLHAPDLPAPSRLRAELGPDNAVDVRAGGWAAGAIVDPVPLQVGEIGGVRSAMISYDNRSIVAEMPTDATLDAAASTYARRIEAYNFPPTTGGSATNYRLFALSFGYAFHVLPYVIGQGGTLPPMLRAAPEDPLTIKPVETADPLKGQVEIAIGTDGLRRSALYRRTRPIGAPRLVKPPSRVPDGVVPLASELPIRPPPVTLGGVIQGRFFADGDGRGGTIEIPAGQNPGLRIDIGRLEWTAGEQREMTITFRGRSGTSEDVVDLLALDHQLTDVGAMRVEVTATMTTIASGVDQPIWSEDEFNFLPKTLDARKPATDIASWRNVQIVISIDNDVDIEPPVVTPLSRQVTLGNSPNIAVAKPRIAPESGHQTRTIYVLDGIKLGTASALHQLAVVLKRPSIEFGTYDRWINPPLFDPALSAGRPVVAKALESALEASTNPNTTKQDRSLDDPAVTQIYAELVCIFPKYKPMPMQPIGASWSALEEIVGFDGSGNRQGTQQPSINVQVGRTEGLSGNNATLLPGNIYELRVYAGVPDKQAALCSFTRDQRLSPAVKATLRLCPIATAMRLAGPLVLTLEVATEAVPDIFATNPLRIELRRPPEQAEQAWIRLTDAVTTSTYPALRYCHLAALESQRWNWRGRPQDDQWHRWPTGNSKPQYDDQFATAFSDRRDDDIGEIFERRIERAQAYGGRERQGDPLPATNLVPRLVDKSLDWRGGVNFWRFGLTVISRYKAMRPGRTEFSSSSHRRTSKNAAWQNKILLDRSYDRTPKRPGLVLVLPLTEPVMAFGAVPPLLVLFNEQLYPNFHAGDGIDAAVEIARHPFTRQEQLKARLAQISALLSAVPPPTGNELASLQAEQTQLQAELKVITDNQSPDGLKYWQEWGPDPIRSGAGSGGAIIPLRLDGPIGYTFDLGTESGRFDHAGLLISPLAQEIWPWSFIKLKFRRLEAPEGIDPATALTGQGPAPATAPATAPAAAPAQPGRFLCDWRPIKLNNAANIFRLSNSRELMQVFGPKDFGDLITTVAKPEGQVPKVVDDGIFPAEHEGLVIDIADTTALDGSSIQFQFTDASDSNDLVKIDFKVGSNGGKKQITFSFSTLLGSAGNWSLPIPPSGSTLLRVVVSAREKPQQGDTYKPVGDIELRARVAQDAADRIASPAENRWLSIACIPLLSNTEVSVNLPVVVVIKAQGAQPMVSPVRLSAFTPALWCQFAEAMSLFDATIDGKPGRPVTTDELLATVAKSGTKVTIGCKPDPSNKPRTLQSLAPRAQPGTGAQAAQVEEVLVLVLTRSIHDAFDRIREKPVAVKLWDGTTTTLDLANPDWPAPIGAGDLGNDGQIRFLRVLRPKTQATGGFIQTGPVFPFDFFQFETIEGDVDMNPPDAKGMVLGMSMPIPWKRAQ